MEELIVNCPKCSHRFPVTQALKDQLEKSLRQSYDMELRTKEKELKKILGDEMLRKLREEKAKFQKAASDEAKKHYTGKIRELTNKHDKLFKEVRARENEIKRKIREETIKELEREHRGKNLKQQKITNDLKKQLSDARARESEIKRNIREETIEEIEKEHREKDLKQQKITNDLKYQLSDAKRKLEQSSQQLQGEIIELELESVLSKAFVDDEIKPVRTGKIGADIIQKVYSSSGEHCGSIIWESKNTKLWQDGWIKKLKSDQRRAKAEIAVLVSKVLPKNIKGRFSMINGVWVSDFETAVGLATALRLNLIDTHRLKLSAEGKDEKMEILYNYLMSTEFKQRVEAIVESFISIREEIEKEKATLERFWAKRERHIQVVSQNIYGMVGDIHAIAPAFPKIRRLELPYSTKRK